MVKQVPLSRGMTALVDDADYERVISAGPWHANPKGRTVYAQRNTRRADGRNTTQSLHCFLVGEGTSFIDHANGDGLDNQRSNLRPATAALNSANRRTRRDSTSGYKGVFLNKGRGRPWRAQIHIRGHKTHIGLFDTPEAAARAYDEAALEAWGGFAHTNYPPEETGAA